MFLPEQLVDLHIQRTAINPWYLFFIVTSQLMLLHVKNIIQYIIINQEACHFWPHSISVLSFPSQDKEVWYYEGSVLNFASILKRSNFKEAVIWKWKLTV
jgi:hypothetical protein